MIGNCHPNPLHRGFGVPAAQDFGSCDPKDFVDEFFRKSVQANSPPPSTRSLATPSEPSFFKRSRISMRPFFSGTGRIVRECRDCFASLAMTKVNCFPLKILALGETSKSGSSAIRHGLSGSAFFTFTRGMSAGLSLSSVFFPTKIASCSTRRK